MKNDFLLTLFLISPCVWEVALKWHWISWEGGDDCRDWVWVLLKCDANGWMNFGEWRERCFE